MRRDNPNPQSRRDKRKMAKANAAKQHTQQAAAPSFIEHDKDCLDAAKKTQGAGEALRDSSSALSDLRAVERTTPETSAVESGVEGEAVPRRQNTMEKAGEAQKVRESGWRHIGRVPGAPDPALTESNPFPRRLLQLPTEVCERIIDWQWDDVWMLHRCARVCKAWTPRCRYWMQRVVALYNRNHVQGHARRARAQPHLLQQARSVWVMGGGMQGERVPIPHLGTLAIMAAAKLPLVWRLDIQDAIWKPSDFHPLIFVHLSAFSSVTTLRLSDVTFPKVREFGRLVCALPSLVLLRCENVLFTSTVSCASLAITRCPPSVRLTDLVISSFDETSSNVEANRALIEHLCAAGVIAGLQRFEFYVWASPDSKYLDAYREPIHELLKQCSLSLHSLEFSPALQLGKDLEADVICSTIASVLDLTCCDSLERVALYALDFKEIGYAWMRRILETDISKKLREVSIVMDRPQYSQDAEENLQRTVSALKGDVCHQLDELFSDKDYEKLRHVNFVFWTNPDDPIPDATEWESLLKANMPKLHERGVLRARVDVYISLFNEEFL